MLIKICVARYKNNFSVCKISWKSIMNQFARILKNRKQRKVILSAMKNFRNESYSNAVNLTNKVVFSKNSKFINVSRTDIVMKEILVNINLNSRAIKYKKTKLIKFSSIEIVEISRRFKKLAQIIKNNQIQSILLNTYWTRLSIFAFANYLIFPFELFKQMFCSIIDEKIKIISKKEELLYNQKT